MRFFRGTRSVWLAAAAMRIAAVSPAQISGDILVTVSDKSGAAIPNARVSVKNLGTGAVRSGVTDPSGAARFSQLGVGDHEVRVEAAGFARLVSPAAVSSGSVLSVPIVVEVRATQQQVVVNESASALATYQFSNLKLPVIVTGGALALTGTAPGAIPVMPRNPFLGLGSFNSNGGRGRGNNITLDNATATDVSTTGAAGLGTVPIDAIKAVNIVTNNFSAEYGRNASAQFQIQTRSGANAFHDRLWDQWSDRTGKPSIERNNRWGGVAGGRLVRDKLFRFGSYEQQKIRGAGSTRIATIPTPAQASGAIDATSKELLTRLLVPRPSGPLPYGRGSVSMPSRARQQAEARNPAATELVPTDPSGTAGKTPPNAADTWSWPA